MANQSGIWQATIAIVGLIASIISIIAWVTPVSSLWVTVTSLMNEPHRPKPAPPPVAEPSPALLSEFRPIRWLPRANNGTQMILAERPRGWWSRPEIVKLICREDSQCSVIPLFFLRPAMQIADIAIPALNGDLLVLDNKGAGMLYRSAKRTISDFDIKVPCAANDLFSGGAARSGPGFLSYGDQYFDGNNFSASIHARNCVGLFKVNESNIDGGVNLPLTMNQENSYYKFNLTIAFDQTDHIVSSSINTDRVSIYIGTAPDWFSYNSTNRTGPILLSAPNRITPLAFGFFDAISKEMLKTRSANIYVYPNIPNALKYNAYLTGWANSGNLIAAVDMSGDLQNGNNGVYFTDSGVISRYTEYSFSRFKSYDELRQVTPRDGVFAVYYGEDFYLPAPNGDQKQQIKNVVEGVLRALKPNSQ